jgi:hypothetical protein
MRVVGSSEAVGAFVADLKAELTRMRERLIQTEGALGDVLKKLDDLRGQLAGAQDANRHAEYWLAVRADQRGAVQGTLDTVQRLRAIDLHTLAEQTVLLAECREWLDAGGREGHMSGYVEFRARLDAAMGDGGGE